MVCIVAYFCQFAGNFPFGTLPRLLGFTVASIVGYIQCFGYASLHGLHCSILSFASLQVFMLALLACALRALACFACMVSILAQYFCAFVQVSSICCIALFCFRYALRAWLALLWLSLWLGLCFACWCIALLASLVLCFGALPCPLVLCLLVLCFSGALLACSCSPTDRTRPACPASAF